MVSKKNLSKSITISAVRIFESLSINQVVTDKRVKLHYYHAKTLNPPKTLIYTDIFLLLVCLLPDIQERIEFNIVSVAL